MACDNCGSEGETAFRLTTYLPDGTGQSVELTFCSGSCLGEWTAVTGSPSQESVARIY